MCTAKSPESLDGVASLSTATHHLCFGCSGCSGLAAPPSPLGIIQPFPCSCSSNSLPDHLSPATPPSLVQLHTPAHSARLRCFPLSVRHLAFWRFFRPSLHSFWLQSFLVCPPSHFPCSLLCLHRRCPSPAAWPPFFSALPPRPTLSVVSAPSVANRRDPNSPTISIGSSVASSHQTISGSHLLPPTAVFSSTFHLLPS